MWVLFGALPVSVPYPALVAPLQELFLAPRRQRSVDSQIRKLMLTVFLSFVRAGAGLRVKEVLSLLACAKQGGCVLDGEFPFASSYESLLLDAETRDVVAVEEAGAAECLCLPGWLAVFGLD